MQKLRIEKSQNKIHNIEESYENITASQIKTRPNKNHNKQNSIIIKKSVRIKHFTKNKICINPSETQNVFIVFTTKKIIIRNSNSIEIEKVNIRGK